jgi:nifR3 family TIM-barrel protein
MRIGSLELKSNLFLSPLAGYTNLPFRLTLREIGGLDLATTDLVNARSLLERNPKAFKLIETCPADRPLAVQLFGSVPEEMRDAAVMLQERGIASIDINMGCPVRKVCRVGGGSAMMTELDKTAALVKGMVDALKIPVTAKMRLGWDDQNLTAPDLARALEGVGVAAIFVHGRTREQGFSGTVNLAGIRAVAEAVKQIPVIGNGDVTTPQAAKKMLDETGCAGVSIGRGAFYDPWIFNRTLHYLQSCRSSGRDSALIEKPMVEVKRDEHLLSPALSSARSGGEGAWRAGEEAPLATGRNAGDSSQECEPPHVGSCQEVEGDVPPEPSFAERLRVLCRHLDLMVEVFGEAHGCRMFRKVAPWYSKRFGPVQEFNKRVVRMSSKAEFQDILESYLRWREQFLDDRGELKPQYRPAPMVASFMQEPGVAQRSAIPVPKGPVEVW